jgi:DNA-directed RNA polymerase specialized sigma24 family protein
VHELRIGDHAAAQNLWEAYFRRLVGLARARLDGRPRGLDEPEDIALSAFDSFCRGVTKGKFPQLNDRHDLWQVLTMLTARKTINAIRREKAVKHGAGAVGSFDTALIERVIGREPTASFAASVAEECRRLLEMLDSEELRTIALCKLEGYSNRQIAKIIGRSLPTVERKLKLIRKTWQEADVDA